VVEIPQGSTVAQFAELVEVSPNDVVKRLFMLGQALTLTQSMSDELIELIADDLGRKVRVVSPEEEFAVVYRYIRASKDNAYLPEILMHRLNMKISLFKLLLILDIMKELYLTTMNSDGGVYYIKINDVSGKVDINASKLLRKLKECAGYGR
uniref:translation initiation factor IF-2 N-terminal domain-containing protein n=1 Tax=Pseudoruminococcus massiliensis TaxID=2086583 RepID=UPI003AEFD7A4